MGRSVFLAVGLLLFLTAVAAAQPTGIKRWASKEPLLWSDFKGELDSINTPYAAATFAGLELEVKEVKFNGLVTFKVRAVFDCKRSWAHPERQTSHILAHEQLHFDIAETYARRLERKLNSMKLKVKDKDKARKLHLQYNQAQMQEQARFDKECVHGLNLENQQAWRSKVDRELRIKRENVKMATLKE